MIYGQRRGDDRIMWEVQCRITGDRVESHIPEGYSKSAATDPGVAYLGLVAKELARRPHRYGYDPNSSYSVTMQTWDRPLDPKRSLAYGRERVGHEQVVLFPDTYYSGSDGYESLYAHALHQPEWGMRKSKVVWRGSVTGTGDYHEPLDIPRVRLARMCRDMPNVDVGIVGIHETMRFPRETLGLFLKQERITADWWSMSRFSEYRWAIDIDGHANAWGLLEKLILGCCVLKVDTPYEQWYYPRLHAWEHYVPVAADLSDLDERIAWCLENNAFCRWIAENGSRLATTLRLRAELPRSCITFLATAVATSG